MSLRPSPLVRRLGAAAFGLALALFGPGCREEAPPAPPAVRGAPEAPVLPAAAPDRPAVPLAPVSAAARVRFALERIATGPLPRTGAFPIPDFHRANLEMAMADLLALPQETLALLESEEVLNRFAGERAVTRDPLHSILDVIASLDPKPVDFALRWAKAGLEDPHVQLRRRGVNVLASVRDPAIGPLLLAALERDAGDREAAPTAFRTLLGLGSPWREGAVEALYRLGLPDLWESVPELLSRVIPLGAARVDADDLLAWWALLAETSGPRLGLPGTARVLTTPYAPLRQLLDAAVTVRDAEPPRPPEVLVGGPLPSGVTDDVGVFAREQAASAVFPPEGVTVTGKASAASARCLLAGADHEAAQHGMRADLGAYDPVTGVGDGVVYYAALHCGAFRARAVPRAEILASVKSLVASARRGDEVDSLTIGRLAGTLATLGEEGKDLLVTILKGLRPAAAFRRQLELAYDALVGVDRPRAVAEVSTLLASSGPDDAGLARHLIHRARDPEYAPVVEEAFAAAGPAAAADYRRLLWWLYSSPGVEPDRLAAFVERYAAWVDEAPDDQAAAQVTGLLDLGDSGARAYAERLRGPRRRVFLEGLLRTTQVVAPEVAEALLEGVDARTPAAERQAVWLAAYRTAPTEAAEALAAAGRRVDPAARGEMADILEVVRHRAPRSPHH